MLNSQLELEEEEKPPKPISVNTLFNALHMCLAASLESISFFIKKINVSQYAFFNLYNHMNILARTQK